MLYKFNQFIVGCALLLGLASCEDVSDMAINRVASPVLSTFEKTYNQDTTVLTVQATFYELDKSGILDQNVGIDSIPVANMPIVVYINETTQLGELMTNGSGEVFFEKELSALSGASVLEWTGTYRQTPFRIRQNVAE